MKTVFKIAKTELRLLFFSPIAWFLLIVFMVQCAIAYVGGIKGPANAQEMGGISLQFLDRLTEAIFGARDGIFAKMMQNLYLYIPLLTMGIISRETGSGTIKLLYSSPVKVWEIVLGKYLSLMVYSLMLIAVAGIFMIFGMFNIVAPEGGLLLSAALGFYLLLCAYAAIGLFMSCLTTYQVVAAVATFIMIGILSYIGTLWQSIDFVRDLTYFLSLRGRTEHMLGGLITTKDVLYFVIIVYIFLGLSILKLKSGMESKPFLVKAGRYAIVIASALLLGYITSRPRLVGYWDVTANKLRTLTPNSQKILKDFGDEPLEITAYNNVLDRFAFLGMPATRNPYLATWEPYTRFKSNIRFNFVNYYDSTAEGNLMFRFTKAKTMEEQVKQYAKNFDVDKSIFKTPAEIRKIIDLRPEHNRFVMQLKYKGRTTFLRVFDDQTMFPDEPEVAAAFRRLQLTKFPKIAFLTGHLERSITRPGDRNYSTLTNVGGFRHALINQGFDVDTLSLTTTDVPADISTLVIADPKTVLDTATLSRIQRYIDNGGNLLIAGEPGKQELLNPLIKQFGVQLMEGIIAQPAKQTAQDVALPDITSTAAAFTKALYKKFKDSMPVSMPGATGLALIPGSGYEAKPLLLTDATQSWMKKDKLVTDSADVVFSPANGDVRGAFTTVAGLTRKVNDREQRIVICGDADFMSNGELTNFSIRTANFVFNTALFNWLSEGEFPIDASRPDAKDKRVKVTTDQVERIRWLLVWILPGILLISGTILLIRRKRQ